MCDGRADRATARPSDGATTIAVRGEVDLCSSPGVRRRLLDAASAYPRDLVVDLTGTAFLDCSGMAAIAAARDAPQAQAGPPPARCSRGGGAGHRRDRPRGAARRRPAPAKHPPTGPALTGIDPVGPPRSLVLPRRAQSAASSSLHACSQRRQASAQTAQCCMPISPWWPHSSPQALHAVAHACRTARVRFAS